MPYADHCYISCCVYVPVLGRTTVETKQLPNGEIELGSEGKGRDQTGATSPILAK